MTRYTLQPWVKVKIQTLPSIIALDRKESGYKVLSNLDISFSNADKIVRELKLPQALVYWVPLSTFSEKERSPLQSPQVLLMSGQEVSAIVAATAIGTHPQECQSQH